VVVDFPILGVTIKISLRHQCGINETLGQATDIKVFTCLFGRLVATYVCILSKTREEFMVYPGKFSFMDQTVIMAYLQKTISFQCFASDKENRSAPLEPIQIIGSSSSSKVKQFILINQQ